MGRSEAQRRYVERNREKVRESNSRSALAYYRRNRDRILASKRASNQQRKSEISAWNRQYYLEPREKLLAYRRGRYRANEEAERATARERHRARYDRERETVREYLREWRLRNLERARVYVRLSGHRRRTASAGSRISADEWLEVIRVSGGCCAYCGACGPLEADPRVPLSRGGSNTIDNILPACISCNRKKHSLTEIEFRQRIAASQMRDELQKDRAQGAGVRRGTMSSSRKSALDGTSLRKR